MKPNITKPLVFFDLESTGLDIAKDRIIQISYIKLSPDGTEERANHFVNPGIPIPKEVQELTSITDDTVRQAPRFKEIAKTLAGQFEGCDFAGYNSNKFDIPLLAEEFLRAGIDFDFSRCRLIDVCRIFCSMEKRTLAAAYQFYCNRKMEDDFPPHLADNDTEATYRVFMAQLDMYQPGRQEDKEKTINNNMDEINFLCNQHHNVDLAGRIVWGKEKDANGNTILNPDGTEKLREEFNFGKHKGEAVTEVLRRDPGFISWMLSSDFTLDTKQVLTRIRLREASKHSASFFKQ